MLCILCTTIVRSHKHTYMSSTACRFRFSLEFWVLCAFCVFFVYVWPVYLFYGQFLRIFRAFSLVCFQFGSQYQCKWLPGKTRLQMTYLLYVDLDVKLRALTVFDCRAIQARIQKCGLGGRVPKFWHFLLRNGAF